MGVKSKLRGLFLQQTMSLVTDLMSPHRPHTRKSVEFAIPELKHFPKNPQGEYYCLSSDSWFPNVKDDFFITSYETHSNLKRLRLKGATYLGFYEIEFTQVDIADKYDGHVVMTIRVDEELEILLPTTEAGAVEITLMVLRYPEDWFEESGFPAIVRNATKNLRRVQQLWLGFSVVGMAIITIAFVTNNMHWFF